MTIEDALLNYDLRVEAGLNTPFVDALASEVRRTQAMRCTTCAHQSKGDGLKVCWHSPIKCTGPYKLIDLTHYPKCETFGGGCLAWEKRDDA